MKNIAVVVVAFLLIGNPAIAQVKPSEKQPSGTGGGSEPPRNVATVDKGAKNGKGGKKRQVVNKKAHKSSKKASGGNNSASPK